MHISGKVTREELSELRKKQNIPDALAEDFVPQPRERRGYRPASQREQQEVVPAVEDNEVTKNISDEADFDNFQDVEITSFRAKEYGELQIKPGERENRSWEVPLSEAQALHEAMPEGICAKPMDAEAIKAYQQKRRNRKRAIAAAVLTVCGVGIIGGGIYASKAILDMGTQNVNEHVGNVEAVKSGQLGASEEDVAMLKAQGYDAQELATTAQGFCTAFFTFTPATIEDGSWEKSFSKYIIDVDDMETTANENMIATRSRSEWKKMVAEHPGYEGEVIGYESLSFGLSDDNLAYCDIVVVVSRPELDRYTMNSPALMIDKALDTYRIVFNENGKIKSVRRLQHRILEQNSDERLAAADARATEKNIAEQRKAQEEAEAKAKAEAEAKAKAEAEAEAKKKKEEEAKKKAEEEEKEREEAEAKAKAEAEAKAKAEAEAAAKKKAEEEAARKKAEEEAARKKAEEEAARAANANNAATS